MNQKHMTRAERQADNTAKRLQGVKIRAYNSQGYFGGRRYGVKAFRGFTEKLVEEFDRMCAVEGGAVITTAGDQLVVTSQSVLDDGQGVTTHAPNMVCMDPNCNLPHGNDSLTIGVDLAKGPDMTSMVVLDEAGEMTAEQIAEATRPIDLAAMRGVEVSIAHSGPTIRDLSYLTGVELAQEIEDRQ